jgi:dimethylglycine dehydrogenase
MKMTPASSEMTAAGCRWGVSWDMEVPLYFAPDGFSETPSLKRSNAFDLVGDECRAVRNAVGLLDISGFSRFEVSGKHAETWLNRVMAGRLPKPGRVKLSPMLSEDGKLKGDLTIFNWGDGIFWIMGSYYLRAWHMRWFNDHMMDGVNIRDLGEEMAGSLWLALSRVRSSCALPMAILKTCPFLVVGNLISGLSVPRLAGYR